MDRWQNQEEAMQFALSHDACMLDMEMGTGKTRSTLDTIFERKGSKKVLIVCPKAVIPVWRSNLQQFHSDKKWLCWDIVDETIKFKTASLKSWLMNYTNEDDYKYFVVLNYDIVWRGELGDYIYKRANFDTVVLDESHRAKAAGSKVSKYLTMLGKRTPYKMCLSGTPMANSPLDVYGQYRFLDPTIYGTNYERFKQQYAILGGPDRKFIVGFKNLNELNDKFRSIAYTCKMNDIKDKLKLPDQLPPIQRMVTLPKRDLKLMQDLQKEAIASCEDGTIAVKNALSRITRCQQIASGFCPMQDMPFDSAEVKELNTAKQDMLQDILTDISPVASVVVFCVYRHDIGIVKEIVRKSKRNAFEISGEKNEYKQWCEYDGEGAVMVVQIQAGAEGIDLTKANYGIYYTVPQSLYLYQQSKARIYRPRQTQKVSFIHLTAEDTYDELVYRALMRKEDIVELVKAGKFNYGYLK